MKTQQQKIQGYYSEVIAAEKLPAIPLLFCRVDKGGACVHYNSLNMQPITVQLDINRCADPEYGILHEIAHLKLLIAKKDPSQRHNSAFRKIEGELVDKYMYSPISFKHFAS